MASETVGAVRPGGGIAALRVTASEHAARVDQLIRDISRTPRHDPACDRMLNELFALRHPSARTLVCVLCEQPLPAARSAPRSTEEASSSHQVEPAPDDDVRYDITQAGRDALRYTQAHDNLFGPWPKVSEVPMEA